jgi:hypothetical protein
MHTTDEKYKILVRKLEKNKSLARWDNIECSLKNVVRGCELDLSGSG